MLTHALTYIQDIVDGVAALLELSRCRHLVGTSRSTYLILAAALSASAGGQGVRGSDTIGAIQAISQGAQGGLVGRDSWQHVGGQSDHIDYEFYDVRERCRLRRCRFAFPHAGPNDCW